VRFSVNGVLFKDLKEKIVRELSKLTADIDPVHPEASAILADVSLGAIRGINIMVMGEVKAPGQYTMKTTISSVFNALAVAGGPTPDGSLREIMVRRPGNAVDRADLSMRSISRAC
jgi:protein involved in polysaccharide export with SLBB domain